jgi:cold shock CspA family protein
MHRGVIVDWFEDRGFGFIRPDQKTLTPGDVFLHHRHIKSGLPRSGATVEFEVTITGERQRPSANNAVILF